MEISFIIVNYQSRQYLDKCIASVFNKVKNIDFEVIVVNNDRDGLELSEDIKALEINNNIGFGKANNLAVKESKGKYLCFLNPDTEILTENIEKITQEFERNQTLGIIGPKVIESSGEVQKWSKGVDVNLWNILRNNIEFSDPAVDFKKQEIAWVTGAALFIKRDLFDKIDGFDERFFLYFEDVDLCRRIRNTGKKVIYFPEVEIKHFGGKSVSSKGEQKKEYYKSQDYYFQKHFGKFNLHILKFLRLFHK